MRYFNPVIHHRRSIRVKGFDYASSGAYFVTICAFQREELFGEIVNEEMRLNGVGRIVSKQMMASAEMCQEIELGEWVIMPNHIHFILWFIPVGAHAMRPGRHAESDQYSQFDRHAGHAEGREDEGRQGAWHAPVRDAGLDRKTDRDAGCERTTGRTIGWGKEQGAWHAPVREGRSLGSFVGLFKAAVTSKIRILMNNCALRVWKRNYYERIIRTDMGLKVIQQYIQDNPRNWERDPERDSKLGSIDLSRMKR